MSKFLSKLKGEKQNRLDLTPDQSSSPSFSSNNPYRYTQSQPPAYQPPPGPPPNHTASAASNQQHKPAIATTDDNPPPYHDWQSIEDTALLPPPPPITSDHSSTTNASYDEAAAAHAWCAQHPVYTPQIPNIQLIEAVQAGMHDLDPPPGFQGRITKLNPATSPSAFHPNASGASPSTVFHISSVSATPSSKPGLSRFLNKAATPSSIPPSGDQTFMSRLPIYFAATSNPLSSHHAHPYTLSLELTPTHFHTADATVSLGFAAKPYPPTRQPGWHRASLAVHSDDGSRYTNDPWGGLPFTAPFRTGETVGLAMVIRPEAVGPATQTQTQSDREVPGALPRCATRVYFSRGGRVVGSWDVDEERDAERDEGVAGLHGEVDLYAAVGVFGGVDVDVRLFGVGGGGFVPPVG